MRHESIYHKTKMTEEEKQDKMLIYKLIQWRGPIFRMSRDWIPS